MPKGSVLVKASTLRDLLDALGRQSDLSDNEDEDMAHALITPIQKAP
jgi:hypothetical protein